VVGIPFLEGLDLRSGVIDDSLLFCSRGKHPFVNIAFFSNQFASASGHGIARYARLLYNGLSSGFPEFNIVPIATGCDRPSAECRALQDDTGLELLPGGRKLLPLAWTFLNTPPLESWVRESIDITHIVSLGFPVATRKKLVVTVHDIGPLTHPQFFTDSIPWLFKRSFHQMVRFADAIICVSQATADEVIQHAGNAIIPRIHVVHEGVDAEYFSKDGIDPYDSLGQMPPAEVPFFMVTGAISPRKNIERVLKAFRQVKDVIEHNLVLVGGKGWDAKDVERTLQSGELAGRVHQLGYVTDAQLQALYRHADFYVHASLFEGFGLPLLEAMASGCPVITSNVSSLPEVAGDAALLVDPLSVDSIADAIKQFAVNPSLCAQFVQCGYQRIQQFRWSDTAKGVATVYRELSG
jgi:glycosyltransferase involved in cell wall biosynthesis